MKKLLPILAIIPLALAACSSEGDDVEHATSTAPTSTSSSAPETSSSAPSSTSTTTPTSQSPAPETSAPVVDNYSPTSPVAAEPTFVTCWENGYAQLSDMSVVEWPDCALPPEEAAALGPGSDPATIPYADGGTCPAYKCGYGHDASGNPNPSNSEIQSWWSDCTATNTTEYCRANDPYQ
ncbi:hypothetical protein [Corynebacterium striatum]|uniref:hypothetical protein n=1 Tax=Corynebacterium striatum TaxID=43770 RepID=UPI003B5AAAC3